MSKIKLMADYGCYPLWVVLPDETRNVNPTELPISDGLRMELLAWSDIYDATLRRDDPMASGFASPEEDHAFEQTGLRLWRSLRSELGTKFNVSYFSHLEGREIE